MTDQLATLDEVVVKTRLVLLDFDGPVTHFFIDGRSQRICRDLTALLAQAGYVLPSADWAKSDPLAIVRWARNHTRPETASHVEETCIAGELRCADEADLTPGATDLLDACVQTHRPVVIVSNNAEAAISKFLNRKNIRRYVRKIIGRPFGQPELMKPMPTMLKEALAATNTPAYCALMVGDSVSDIEAAKRAATMSVGYGKNPKRFQELSEAGADGLVVKINDLAAVIAQSGSRHTARTRGL